MAKDGLLLAQYEAALASHRSAPGAINTAAKVASRLGPFSWRRSRQFWLIGLPAAGKKAISEQNGLRKR